MNRLRPYFRYLRPHRSLLFAAIICGILAGVASGAGLPLMISKIFPVIFGEGARELSTGEIILVTLWLPSVLLD